MRNPRSHCTHSLVVALTVLLTGQSLADDSEDFQDLFNGRDLTGWVHVNTAESTWKVQDGLLICSGKPIGELRTDRMYQNFILELEWRHMVPKGNAGVFVWADDITARGVPFHRSIEVQVLENAYGNNQSHTTHGDIFPIHGARMKPINGRGGSRAFPTEWRSKPSPEWNHYRIECRDGNISLAVNGEVVTRGTDCSPRKGYICLESEGGVVHYRNVRIRELPATPIKPEDVAIANRGFRCLYRGIDLTGWQATGSGWEAKNWVLSFAGEDTASLTTEERFEQAGFIFDFRLKSESRNATVEVCGFGIPIAGDGALGVQAKVGQWNRCEAIVHEGNVSLRVNGGVVELPAATTKVGPVRLEADAPIDFANIYVREL